MSWARFDDDARDHAKWLGLSGDAFKLGFRLVLWARRHSKQTGVVPAPVVREMGGGGKRAARLIKELVDAGKPLHEIGILETQLGAFKVHDFEKYGPPQMSPPPEPATPQTHRSEAARQAGIRSAEARRARTGSAQPGRPRSNDSPNESSNDSRTTPERSPNESSNDSRTARASEPDPDPGKSSNRKPVEDSTGLPARPRGARPSVRPGLLMPKQTLRSWEVPDDYREYALELGLGQQEYADVVEDCRSKVTRQAEETWLSSILCRFIEQRAEKRREGGGTSKPRAEDPPARRYTGELVDGVTDDELGEITRKNLQEQRERQRKRAEERKHYGPPPPHLALAASKGARKGGEGGA